MASTVAFELVSPERLLLSEEAEMILIPGSEGDFGIQPGHALFISGIRPGVLSVYNNGKVEKRIFVSGGFAEATPERCIVLAEEAMALEDLNAAEIESEITNLKEDISAPETPEKEKARAEKSLSVAEAKLTAAKAA